MRWVETCLHVISFRLGKRHGTAIKGSQIPYSGKGRIFFVVLAVWNEYLSTRSTASEDIDTLQYSLQRCRFKSSQTVEVALGFWLTLQPHEDRRLTLSLAIWPDLSKKLLRKSSKPVQNVSAVTLRLDNFLNQLFGANLATNMLLSKSIKTKKSSVQFPPVLFPSFPVFWMTKGTVSLKDMSVREQNKY